MAANVHTGHSLLMAKVFHEKLFHGLDLRQMIGCISLFVQNGKEFPVLYDGGELSENGVKCAEALFELAKKYSKDNSPETYWTLDASWVDIVMRWLDGEDAFIICRDYELYEGDFVKALLKLRKVVEEWVVLAGISDDLDMLEKFRDVEPMIIRGIVTQDSLYIRL
jgi:superfamily II RNA helicase